MPLQARATQEFSNLNLNPGHDCDMIMLITVQCAHLQASLQAVQDLTGTSRAQSTLHLS